MPLTREEAEELVDRFAGCVYGRAYHHGYLRTFGTIMHPHTASEQRRLTGQLITALCGPDAILEDSVLSDPEKQAEEG